jgi:hypothetical protein
MLGQESGAGVHQLRPSQLVGLDRHARPDRVTVADRADEADGE